MAANIYHVKTLYCFYLPSDHVLGDVVENIFTVVMFASKHWQTTSLVKAQRGTNGLTDFSQQSKLNFRRRSPKFFKKLFATLFYLFT